MATQKTGFVTDAGGFHYFYLQDTILQEAVFGIILSVALAFIVLVMATGNYIVSAMASPAAQRADSRQCCGP